MLRGVNIRLPYCCEELLRIGQASGAVDELTARLKLNHFQLFLNHFSLAASS